MNRPLPTGTFSDPASGRLAAAAVAAVALVLLLGLALSSVLPNAMGVAATLAGGIVVLCGVGVLALVALDTRARAADHVRRNRE